MVGFFQRLLPALKSGEWLDRRRIAADAAILLAFEVLAFLFVAAHTYNLILPVDKPSTTDFVGFYAAGSLADRGMAPAAYDITQHLAAEEAVTGHGIDYVLFAYPPVFMLICAALALGFDADWYWGELAICPQIIANSASKRNFWKRNWNQRSGVTAHALRRTRPLV